MTILILSWYLTKLETIQRLLQWATASRSRTVREELARTPSTGSSRRICDASSVNARFFFWVRLSVLQCSSHSAGSGESGKSTIVKQMKILHQGGFSVDELASFRPIIYKNVLDSAQAVVLAMRKIGTDCTHPSNRVCSLSSVSRSPTATGSCRENRRVPIGRNRVCPFARDSRCYSSAVSRPNGFENHGRALERVLSHG